MINSAFLSIVVCNVFSAVLFLLISVIEEKRYIKVNGRHYLVVGFKAGKYSGELKLTEPDKFKEWRWFSLDDLPDKMLEATELMIRNYKAGKIYQS